jgi:hypothetical protein
MYVCPAGGWDRPLNGYAVSDAFNLRDVYYPYTTEPECEALCAARSACRSYSFRKVTKACALKAATCAEAGVGHGCRLVRPEFTNLQTHRDKSSEWPGLACVPSLPLSCTDACSNRLTCVMAALACMA